MADKLSKSEIQFMLWLRKQSMLADALRRMQLRQEFGEARVDEVVRQTEEMRGDFKEVLRILMMAKDPAFKSYQDALKDGDVFGPQGPPVGISPNEDAGTPG